MPLFPGSNLPLTYANTDMMEYEEDDPYYSDEEIDSFGVEDTGTFKNEPRISMSYDTSKFSTPLSLDVDKVSPKQI